ncbi:MAG TPA: AlpA family phage regulatory protein [Nitrospinaceae bacterium]|nr:AlpA family phage regulatory protein [Nitrospinaceae bacterium]
MTLKVLSIKQISEATGLSPVTIWRKEKAGEFPVRRQLGSRRVGWLNREIDECLEATPKSKITSPKHSQLKNQDIILSDQP